MMNQMVHTIGVCRQIRFHLRADQQIISSKVRLLFQVELYDRSHSIYMFLSQVLLLLMGNLIHI